MDSKHNYSVVPQAIFLTIPQTTHAYQAIADLLAKGRDQGRWTPLTTIRDHFQKEVDASIEVDRVRSYLDNMIEWGLVLSDTDETGIRTLREIHHQRIRYQLSHAGSVALKFRDELVNPESGSLADHRPGLIRAKLKELHRWITTHIEPASVDARALKELVGLWSEIDDTLNGMQTDADKFLSLLEVRVRDLAKNIEVPEGETHPLIVFRRWIEDYILDFVNEVQRLRLEGSEILARLSTNRHRRADGEEVTAIQILKEYLIRAEVDLKGDIAREDSPEAHANRIIERLRILISSDGHCHILATRAHAALDRYLAAVKRIRIRMGSFAGTTKARTYSAMAAKIAHISEEEASRLASVITPERPRFRFLDLADFPRTKPGRDPWNHPADWHLILEPTRRGGQNFTRSRPVKRAPLEQRTEAYKARAERERKEAAFWKSLLSAGEVSLQALQFDADEARWFLSRISKGMVDPKRRFRLKDGTQVEIQYRKEADAVTELDVENVGRKIMAPLTLRVVR